MHKDCDTRGRALQTPVAGAETARIPTAKVVSADAASGGRRTDFVRVRCIVGVDVSAISDIAQYDGEL